ncbi:MAG: bis(5'-nucleosyl)-tetraphosphatase (symmetrical) YqeK [bacterium]|jgi:predicted HD superfamily hydrolase involved in NAD metabolism
MLAEAEIEQKLREKLSAARWAHSRRVQATAGRLALKYGADVGRARLAGLVHDCAKGMTAAELMNAASLFGLKPDRVEIEQPDLLHGPVGAGLCRREFGITDEAVLSAVSKHTTGDGKMAVLEKIIYIADYTEPGRVFPGVGRLRAAAERDLDCAVLLAADQTIRYVTVRGWLLHPRTLAAREAARQKVVRKGVNCHDDANKIE